MQDVESSSRARVVLFLRLLRIRTLTKVHCMHFLYASKDTVVVHKVQFELEIAWAKLKMTLIFC